MKRKPTKADDHLPVLISYAFLKTLRAEVVAQLLNTPGIEVLLDSGAFTAMNAGYEISLDDYMPFLHTWKHRLFGYMALDKLQDPAATARNLKVMVKEGLKPIPVHVFGDGAKKMDELFALSDWVALGGLRRPHRGGAPKSYVKQKMEWAKGRNVHWLGYTIEAMLRAFGPFSADCSSFAAGMRYGRVQLYAGAGRWYSFTYEEVMKQKPHLRPEIKRLLAEYEVSSTDFTSQAHWHNGSQAEKVRSRDSILMRLPVMSWIRYVLEFKREFGTRIFMATLPAHFSVIVECYRFVISKGLHRAAA